MPIHVDWDNPEQTTLLWTVEGRWTWAESHEAIAKAEAMMDSVPHQKVASIVDMSRGHLIPDNAVSQFSRTLKASHPKTGTIVMAGMPPFVQSLLYALTRAKITGNRKIIVAKTLDEARAVLAAEGQTGAESS